MGELLEVSALEKTPEHGIQMAAGTLGCSFANVKGIRQQMGIRPEQSGPARPGQARG